MNFISEIKYGKEYFYPKDEEAEEFLKLFPHSSGKRKCLVKKQIEFLKKCGSKIVIEKLAYVTCTYETA